MIGTHEVITQSESTATSAVYKRRDAEIAALKSRPREKEVVVETREVVNHDEVNRLGALLR